MGVIQVQTERAIAAPPAVVYGYLADMNEHQRFLSPAFSDFQIESGGVGAGTKTSFAVTAGGRTRRYRMTIAEPAPGVLTETDADSSLVTTFTVTPGPSGSRVQIATTWKGATGIGGFFERTFAPKALVKLYDDELARLEAFVLEREKENAEIDEAGEESFPTSDPPAF